MSNQVDETVEEPSVSVEEPSVSGEETAKDVDVGVFVSRVIEFLPPTVGVIARDCIHVGGAFSKGAVLKTDTGTYRCTGDKDGTWKKIKEAET